MEDKRIIVRFMQPDPPYNVGDIAGFSLQRARQLIGAEIVVLNDSNAAETLGEIGSPPAVTFASPQAAKKAEDIPPESFEGVEPSSTSGYTTADVDGVITAMAGGDEAEGEPVDDSEAEDETVYEFESGA